MNTRKIYVLSHGHNVTGGVELSHQLVYKLNLLGFQASICYVTEYVPGTGAKDTKKAYEKYHCPYVDGLIQDEEAIYVIVEGLGDYFTRIKSPYKVFWWLSVDYLVLNLQTTEDIMEWLDAYHLVQSEYARQYAIQEMSVPEDRIFWLSDYINSEYLECEAEKENREDIVLFNPKKGTTESATLIVNSTGKIKWQALNGLSVTQMRQAMAKAKVYIDFGSHPGKDRIPREAALQGLCIVTNRKGAAKNPLDVAIPEQYKFEELTIQPILQEIYDLCENYEERKKLFLPYVEKTKQEFREFECDILRFFQGICGIEAEERSEQAWIEILQQEIETKEYQKAYPHMVAYRCMGFPDTKEYLLLEAEIRRGMKEYLEADYILQKADRWRT